MVFSESPRVIGTLVGDIYHEAPARTKYGMLFEKLNEQLPVVQVCDATLRGVDRLLNGLLMFHPQIHLWKERFYQNIPAFKQRSAKIARHLAHLQQQNQADVVLQVGATFDAQWGQHNLPSVLYTDYTTHLSMLSPDAGRSPFSLETGKTLISLEKQAFQRATFVCTRSQIVRESILQEYKIAPEKVVVVGGGVNFETLPNTLNTPNMQGQPTILFIGKDFYRKGGDLLLNAFAQTRHHVPHGRLIMMTEGVPAGVPLDGVEIVSPTWDRTIIENLYQQADIFVLPSRLETWGDVLLEAMAYGIVCIGATRQAMGEIIQHGKTGLVVAPGDEHALFSALLWLMINPSLRRKWGKNGRDRLESHFTWGRVAERLAPVLKEAVALHNPHQHPRG